MTPILYEKDEIDFTSQGLGSLVEIYDVDVEEQRNGLLQLTASYPVSGVRYADISVGRIILAKPNQRDDVHAFRIVSTELDISGYAVTIEADSITYDLAHNIVKHLNVSGNGQAFMTALKNAVVNPSIFEFYSDIATSSTTSLNYVNPMEAIMGTTGSFLQIWGGEIKRENRRIAMLNRRGRDNVSTFRLGKNIAGLKYSVDISSLVTRIIPTKSVQNDDQTTTTLEGKPVDSQYINNYEQVYTLPLEFTDDTIKTVSDLNAAAKGWFTQSANTGKDKPTVTIDIDVLSLQDSADYQDKFKNLESVSLTDTVTVYVPEYGVNVTAIVNELHYDPILDRVTKMTVGTAKQSFADSSRTQLSDLQDKIISVQNQADAAAVSANGKNKNYYGSVAPPHPQEGDTWYWVDGDKSGAKVFVNGDWVDLVDSDTQAKIAAAVDEAVTQAKIDAQTLINNNNTTIRAEMQTVATQKAKDEIAKGNFDVKAQSYANDAKTSAIASAQTLVNAAASDAASQLAAAKTDLTNKYTTVKAQADGLSTSFNSYTKVTDSTLVSYKGLIDANSKAITLAATKTELNAATSSFNSQIASIKTDYDSVTTSVTELSGKLNDLGQVNLVNNSDLSPDLSGWTVTTTVNPYSVATTDNSGSQYYSCDTGSGWFTGEKIPVNPGDTVSASIEAFIPNKPSSMSGKVPLVLYVTTLSKTGGVKQYLSKTIQQNEWKNTPTQYKFETITLDSDVYYVRFELSFKSDPLVVFGKPMLVLGSTVGSYVRGKYSNNDKIAAQQVTINSISSIVSDPTTGLSVRVQTAEGTLSTVKSTADGASSKAEQLAGQFTQEVSDRKTGDANTLSQSKSYTTSNISSAVSGLNSTITQTSNGFMLMTSATNLVVDSSLINSSIISDVDPTWDVDYYSKAHWYYSSGVSYMGVQSMGVDTRNYTIPSYLGARSQPWNVTSFTGNKLYVSVDARVSNVGGTDDDYVQVVLKECDSDGDVIVTNDITGALSVRNTSWTNYRSTVTVNSSTKTLYLEYMVFGKMNAYMARPFVGNVELPAGGYTPGPIQSTSTILSLLKDNWSIGITDNLGNIVSGIVGTPAQMAVISKNVIIDSPNTQITGTAWIKSAMIANGAIGTAQIGDASISSAKILSLDASKISTGTLTTILLQGPQYSIDLSTGIQQSWRYVNLTSDIKNVQMTSTNSDGSLAYTNSYDPKIEGSVGMVWSGVGSADNIFPLMQLQTTSYGKTPISEIEINATNATAGYYIDENSAFVRLHSEKNRSSVGMAAKTIYIGVDTNGSNTAVQTNDVNIGGEGRAYVGVGSSVVIHSMVNNSNYGDFVIGYDSSGPRIYSNAVYNRTYSGSASMTVTSAGTLGRITSARKYKTNIMQDVSFKDSLHLLDIPLSTWDDKAEIKSHGVSKRYFGMIAEDVAAQGLDYLVQRNEEGGIEGLNYDRIALLLVPIVKKMYEDMYKTEGE